MTICLSEYAEGVFETRIVGTFVSSRTVLSNTGVLFAEAAVKTGILKAFSSATIIAFALEKRIAGSLAILRIMTEVTAAGIIGLMREGVGAIALMCCVSMSFGVSP